MQLYPEVKTIGRPAFVGENLYRYLAQWAAKKRKINKETGALVTHKRPDLELEMLILYIISHRSRPFHHGF
jgi:hypothetical protein